MAASIEISSLKRAGNLQDLISVGPATLRDFELL